MKTPLGLKKIEILREASGGFFDGEKRIISIEDSLSRSRRWARVTIPGRILQKRSQSIDGMMVGSCYLVSRTLLDTYRGFGPTHKANSEHKTLPRWVLTSELGMQTPSDRKTSYLVGRGSSERYIGYLIVPGRFHELRNGSESPGSSRELQWASFSGPAPKDIVPPRNPYL